MLKRWVLGAAILAVVFITAGAAVYAEDAVKIIVNGKEIKSDVPPQIIDGRTMVPLRAVAEALDAKVDWDAANNKVTIAKPYNLLKLNGELTTWPYWYEGGHLYLEQRDTIELLRIGHNAQHWSISYDKDYSRLSVNNLIITVPYIKKGDFTAISITFLNYNRNLINFDFDQATGNLTLLPIN